MHTPNTDRSAAQMPEAERAAIVGAILVESAAALVSGGPSARHAAWKASLALRLLDAKPGTERAAFEWLQQTSAGTVPA